MNAVQVGQFIVKQSSNRGKPMSMQITRLLMGLLMAPDDDANRENVRKVMADSFIHKIFNSRVEVCVKKTVDPRLALWLGALCDRPGTAVLMVAVVKYADSIGAPLTLHAFMSTIFPYGVPSDEIMSEAWQMQKDGGANVLDMEAAWT